MGKVMTADAHRLMVDCLKAAGAASKPTVQQAELLIHADKIGQPSQRPNRLEQYVNDILKNVCMPNNEPKILKENDATAAWVDATDVLGTTSAHFSLDLAIQKACNEGLVSLKGANHYGMGGFWDEMAAEKGMIGMALTNTSPFLTPTRSKKAELGNNSPSVVAPGLENEIFCLDKGTSAVAFGKIEMQGMKGEPFPPGWVQGPDGNKTLDADLASKSRCLMPQDGLEVTSEYQGCGLAAMVEMFSGILSV